VCVFRACFVRERVWSVFCLVLDSGVFEKKKHCFFQTHMFLSSSLTQIQDAYMLLLHRGRALSIQHFTTLL
jgi:hypothetical protein